jgi:hypothetical protein
MAELSVPELQLDGCQVAQTQSLSLSLSPHRSEDSDTLWIERAVLQVAGILEKVHISSISSL